MNRLLTILVCVLLATSGAHARELQAYKGNPNPPPLKLQDLKGAWHDLESLRGKVVLVNFWATWCPPCVHEIPSMQRLKNRMQGKPFVILAVDMAEPEQDIRAFLKKFKVDFTVLLDKDGKALQAWKIFAFPTSFVLGPDGKIRYALPGALEWDAPDVIEKIEALLPK
jgi:thiol-disulfide isomerase/thioredoxin